MRIPAIVSVFVALACASGTTAGAEFDTARTQPPAARPVTQRLIVKLRTADASARARAQSGTDETPVTALARRTHLTLRTLRSITGHIQVVELAPEAGGARLDAALARLRADPDVVYAEPDYRRYALAVPDDPLFDGQWFLQNVEASAIDAVGAWDVTQGSDGVVVADIDTGVRYEHPDLGQATGGGRLLPGYDFIAEDSPSGGFLIANDGDGRDPDPSDPGDWLTTNDLTLPIFQDCGPESDSSWHGTRTAGILGARTNNATGVAGVTWNTYILPVRVLGKCGGFDSDIIAGMLWAAGLTVSGVPDNPYPARIENLSLGSTTSCPASYVDAVEQLTAAGVLVVASAGNEGGPVGTPASCPGVVGVAGLRHIGTKVGFSSLGPEVALSAPGGNCVNTAPGTPCLFSLDTTSNSGDTVPESSIYTDQFNSNVGTSFSAPIVTGIAALMVSVNGNLTPSLLTARLQEGTVPFPVSPDPNIPACHVPAGPGDIQDFECNCTTSTCGAGMADARAAVAAAQRPIAAVTVVGDVMPGQDFVLDATGSAAACGQAIATYDWAVISGSGVISPGDEPGTENVTAPATGSFTVHLTVTDDAGLQDTADIVVTPTNAGTDAPTEAQGVACPVAITIELPEINLTGDLHVGEDLQTNITIALSVAPLTPVDITVTVGATGTALVSESATSPGTKTVVLEDVADADVHTVVLQGIALGTTSLNLSAPDFATRSSTVTVDPSGFIIDGGAIDVLTTAANQAVTVDSARLEAGTLAFVAVQPLRAGLTVDVAVESSNATVGVIANSPLSFDGAVSSLVAQFDPLAAGTTTISVDAPAGFDLPSGQAQITATVTGESSGGGGGGGAVDAFSLFASLCAAVTAARRGGRAAGRRTRY
jgi:serine protease